MHFAIIQLALSTALIGASDSDPSEAKTYSGRAADTEITTPALEQARIDIDGRLDDAAWQQAALLTSFTQYKPVEGAEASQRTEVQVLVDADAIYFAIKAFDNDPSGIRATLSERDSYTFSDDYVRLILDTFDDSRKAYVFTVNPLGVQHDGIWNESGGSSGRMHGNFGSPIDNNPDFLWDSDGVITEWGYQIEIRVPFKSLRFPEAEEQSWGLHVLRKIQRSGFESSWAPITNNVSNKLTQAGKLNGLRNLDMGLFMELNPVLTGKRIGEFDSADGLFQREDPSGDFGLNATYWGDLQSHVGRHIQPGLQPDRGRRGPDCRERAVHALLPGEEALLPGGDRDLWDGEAADLYALGREPDRGCKTHRKARECECRLPRCD